MPYPDYLDMIQYYSDPEKYMKTSLTEEQVEEKKQGINDALTKLRQEE